MTIEAGKMLGSYRLEKRLGAGGMGVVWRAVDTRLDRAVALKVLPADAVHTPQQVARFEREAKAVAALNHPNIVTLYSVEEADTVPPLRFITMELVEGPTLDRSIPPHGMSLESFFGVAIPLADALCSAHERGIVHRDIKPSNIMITDDGRPKVLDFGLAKLAEPPAPSDATPTMTLAETETQVTGSGQVMGTAPYMSPEQLRGGEIDHRTDIFSLGIVLYEMATGRRPFAGGSSAELISSIMRDDPAPVTEVKVDFPNHLGRIVRHCLVKDRERRYQTAKDLRNELEELKRETTLSAMSRPPETPSPSRKRAGRPSWRPALAAIVVLGVAVGALLWFGRARDPEPPPRTVAVLPFVDLTGDPDSRYFSRGLGAGLITELSDDPGLQVIGRAESWQSGDRGEPIADIARRLGVGAIVQGEVQRAREGVRIEVKLTDASTGVVMWSDTHEGRGDTLFGLQQKIAGRLAAFLRIVHSAAESARRLEDPGKSYQAYGYYLRAQQRIGEHDERHSADSAAELLRQAIRLDPGFALAHAGLSRALWIDAQRRDDTRERLEEAEREAQRALELAPELPEALVALARVQRSTGRTTSSIGALEGALARHPRPDAAQRELSFSYRRIGEWETAEEYMRAATTLGEDDWENWNSLGALLEELGRYAEAGEAFERAAAVAPEGIGIPMENLAAISLLQGRIEEALTAYERIPGPIRDPRLASNIGTAYYFSDRPDKWARAEEFYNLATELSARDPIIQRNLADLLLEVGREEEALAHYRRAREIVEDWLAITPQAGDLRRDRAIYTAKAGDCGEALPLAERLTEELPETAANAHSLATVFALCDAPARALDAVRRALDLGFSPQILQQESEFRELAQEAEFERLVRDATRAGR